jgi:hypothetical protein
MSNFARRRFEPRTLFYKRVAEHLENLVATLPNTRIEVHSGPDYSPFVLTVYDYKADRAEIYSSSSPEAVEGFLHGLIYRALKDACPVDAPMEATNDE